MRAIEILRSADIVPVGALGQRRVSNKAALLKDLERHRISTGRLIVATYVVALAAAVVTVMLALHATTAAVKGATPVVGGAAFIALLEFCRRLTKDWMAATLPLRMAVHASDEQLATLIEGILTGMSPRRPTPVKSGRQPVSPAIK